MIITTNVLKLLIPTFIAFVIGIVITPPITKQLYRYRMWKRRARLIAASENTEDAMSPEFQRINNAQEETSTPRIGGVIIWLSVIATVALVWLAARFLPSVIDANFDFLSRSQTWIPVTALVIGSLVGLADDVMGILVTKGKFINGFPRNYMLGIVATFGLVMGCWFYYKLGIGGITIPFYGFLTLGWFFIPLFVIITLATFSSGVIDGIDGLAGGVMSVIFGAYAVICLLSGRVDMATLCLVITSGILAFLWFNIPPARFYMGETGMLGLTFALTTVVFLTDSLIVFPIIAMPLVATSLSSFIQILSKKIRGPEKGKVFRVAPLHHHFEAIGWSRAKITMRYWVLSVMFAVLGVIVWIIGYMPR